MTGRVKCGDGKVARVKYFQAWGSKVNVGISDSEIAEKQQKISTVTQNSVQISQYRPVKRYHFIHHFALFCLKPIKGCLLLK